MREFDRALPMMLYRALGAVLPLFRAVFTQFNLTETQWRVLRALWDEDGRAFNELARAILTPAPSLVGIVDRLTRDGLITRRPSDDDRRQVHICLTPRGKALRSRIEPLVSAAYDELESCLRPQQWRELYDAIDQLCRCLEEKNAENSAVRGRRSRRPQRGGLPSASVSRKNEKNTC
jgi:homoprotocatechuate degradation regulator HpaR